MAEIKQINTPIEDAISVLRKRLDALEESSKSKDAEILALKERVFTSETKFHRLVYRMSGVSSTGLYRSELRDLLPPTIEPKFNWASEYGEVTLQNLRRISVIAKLDAIITPDGSLGGRDERYKHRETGEIVSKERALELVRIEFQPYLEKEQRLLGHI